jgi:hypothetical protein
MIIIVSREAESFSWTVTPLTDDGEPLAVRGRAISPTVCAGDPWTRIGQLVTAYAKGDEVTIRYTDDNSMDARLARLRALNGDIPL